MIHVLARLIARQICMPKERTCEEPDPPPPLCQHVEQPPLITRARCTVKTSSPGVQTLSAGNEPEQLAQALVVLFTELAQRRVQARRMRGGNP